MTETSKYGLKKIDGTDDWRDLADDHNDSMDLIEEALSQQAPIFAVCSTAADTAAKTVATTDGDFELATGAKITVLFANKNTAASPTLNVDNTGAKNIYAAGYQIASGDTKGLLAGALTFVYDGTQWQLIGNYINTSNTAGASNSTGTRIYPVGAYSQVGASQTFSNANVYIDTDNEVYSGGKKVAHHEDVETLQNGIAIIVDGDTAAASVPVGGYAYIKNNTHSLAEGLYKNTGSGAFPTSGAQATSSYFTAVSGGIGSEVAALNSNLIKPFDITNVTRKATYSNKSTYETVTYTADEDGYYWLTAISSGIESVIGITLYDVDYGILSSSAAGSASAWKYCSTAPTYLKAGQTVTLALKGNTIYLNKASAIA